MKQKIIYLFILLLGLTSCNKQQHFISDDTYRKQVFDDFEEATKLATNRSEKLFGVFNTNLTLTESEALKFLYAYMPLNDLADYDGEFFLQNVRTALKARESFEWGKEIPEDIFRHYVLPPRINNENFDTARVVFYKELTERLKGLTLKEAALEVNHWCHEKVIYQPTSERTIAPLSVIKSAYGRCGEESTFAVTALRAACIPARQCYTPRWAHVDDNHAWVEVWVDGTWCYLGACEPEPRLNIAWFDEPVLRAMLVHSKVMGQYKGNEIVDKQNDKFAYMNLIGNYAPTKKLIVKVIDRQQLPLKNINVEFQLYNYAEFYPLSAQKTDADGLCSFTTGFGDLLIWAHNNKQYSYKKVTVETTDTVELIVENNKIVPYSESFTLVPPIERVSKVLASEQENLHNNARLVMEDSIRNIFVETFMQESEAKALGLELGLNEGKVWQYIEKSRGNWPQIVNYLKQAAAINKKYALLQLDVISDKDLRDVEATVLLGNLKASVIFSEKNVDTALFASYIINPRVAHEKLTDSKTFLTNVFKKEHIHKAEDLIKWIKNEIIINDELNYYNIPITPKGVYELKIADKFSCNLFFVLGCRALGIPARFEPATNIPQFFVENNWNDASFEEKQIQSARPKGIIEISKAKELDIDPLYRVHFSITKLESGRFTTLDYGWDKPLSEVGTTLSVDTGTYMIITGNRQSSGSVSAQLKFFNVSTNQTIPVVLQLLDTQQNIMPLAHHIGSLRFEDVNHNPISIDTEKPCVLVWIDANKEPSKHALNDIQKMEVDLSNSELSFYFIVNKTTESSKNPLNNYVLPKNSYLLYDTNNALLKTISKEANSREKFPFIILMQGSGIYYKSLGYNIGVGEQLLKTINQLKKN